MKEFLKMYKIFNFKNKYQKFAFLKYIYYFLKLYITINSFIY